MNNPRDLLEKALRLQESNKPIEALNIENQALLEFAQASDTAGFAEVTVLRSKTLKHLYQQSDNKNYLILARAEAQGSVEIAENSSDKYASAIPYFVLAQLHEALEEYPPAKIAYQKSLEYLPHAPQPKHNRKSVKADIEGHLAFCEFKSGEKDGLQKALSALIALEASDDADSYEYNVWLTGAHMRIASIYHQLNNPQQAQTHVDKTREIIKSDERLILRKSQLEKMTN